MCSQIFNSFVRDIKQRQAYCQPGGCCCSVAKSCLLFVSPWTAAHQAPLSFTVSRSLLKLVSIESVMMSKHLILYCPLFLLPSVFPRIKVFSSCQEDPMDSTKRQKECKFLQCCLCVNPKVDDRQRVN